MGDKNIDVVALGEALIDFTPAGRSEDGRRLFEQNPGGAPANVLATLSKLGHTAAFVGKVGDDMHGHFLKHTMQEAGIDVSGLLLDPAVFTTLAFVELGEGGERSFAFARKPGADTQICLKEIESRFFTDTKVLHVGSLSLTDEPARTTTYEAVKHAKDAGAVISYDPNYRADLWESREIAIERMQSLIPYVDIMKISDEETGLLTPYQDAKEAAAYLLQQGVKIVAVTMGAGGALLSTSTSVNRIPGFSSHAIDTTGAGDAFWGAFLSGILAKTLDIESITSEEVQECALYANALASLCVEKRGGISSIPQPEEVEERLKELKIMK
ncbi:MAG: carbohydrate kinase family protein [Lachnospiraceae bacterium]